MIDEEVYFDSIPYDDAVRICLEIQKEAHMNWDSPTARWCWSCRQSCEDNPKKIAYLKKPGNRGCHLINIRYIQFLREEPES